MKKRVMRFSMVLMALCLCLEAAPQKAKAAGNDTDTVTEQTAADDPAVTGMTEGSGTDLFGDSRMFPCWYNKEDDLYYMDPAIGYNGKMLAFYVNEYEGEPFPLALVMDMALQEAPAEEAVSASDPV